MYTLANMAPLTFRYGGDNVNFGLLSEDKLNIAGGQSLRWLLTMYTFKMILTPCLPASQQSQKSNNPTKITQHQQ